MVDTADPQLTPRRIESRLLNDTTIHPHRDNMGDLSRCSGGHNRDVTATCPDTPAGTHLEEWLATARPDRNAGRLIQFLRSLNADPSIRLETTDGWIPVPANELTLGSLMKRCEVESRSTPRAWLSAWRDAGWLIDLPEPRIDLYALTGKTRQNDSPSQAQPHRQRTHLDVLLTHLHAAHTAHLTELAEQITSWIQAELETTRAVAPSARTPTTPRDETPRDETSKEQLVRKSLTNSAKTMPRDNRAGRSERTDKELHDILKPLLEQIHRLALTPMTNTANLEKALRPYTNQQITHAVRTIIRQLHNHQTKPITSPIGLLVVAARQNNPSYFPPPTRHTTAAQPPHKPTPKPAANPETHLSSIRTKLRT